MKMMNFTTTGAVLAVLTTAALSFPAQAKWIRCQGNLGGPGTVPNQLGCPDQDTYGVELRGLIDFFGNAHASSISNPNNYQYQVIVFCKCTKPEGCPNEIDLPMVPGDAVAAGESTATCAPLDYIYMSGRFWVP
jgi:hypothetical protein